jgi:hypothetical protein
VQPAQVLYGALESLQIGSRITVLLLLAIVLVVADACIGGRETVCVCDRWHPIGPSLRVHDAEEPTLTALANLDFLVQIQ